MCAECGFTVCHPRCPNAPEPMPIHRCKVCKGGIYFGDQYFDSSKGPICSDCLNDMTAGEILELVGECLTTAEKEE